MDPKALKYFNGECFKHFGADCNGKIVDWIKRRSPPISLFQNPAPPFKQSDPDLLQGIHWDSVGR